MASGSDARVGIAKETVYGTRVSPTRFLPLTSEGLEFEFNRYFSPAIGTGLWGRPSVVTSGVGKGALKGDATTTGMGILFDALHGNAVTPVQQGGTIAYLQTHTLDTPPSKSYTVQVQTPPVGSSTLVPHDLLGVMFSGITFSWKPDGVLSYELPSIVRDLDIAQSLATYTPPTAYTLFSFQQGSLTIGGALEANIVGDGSVEVGYELRDDALALGTGGRIAKPVLTAKPAGRGEFTADFNDNTNLTRVLNNTIADVVLKFEGSIIASTYKWTTQITLPDCVFTTKRPTVEGPGPVQQTVAFETASSTADAPVITYMSTDTVI